MDTAYSNHHFRKWGNAMHIARWVTTILSKYQINLHDLQGKDVPTIFPQNQEDSSKRKSSIINTDWSSERYLNILNTTRGMILNIAIKDVTQWTKATFELTKKERSKLLTDEAEEGCRSCIIGCCCCCCLSWLWGCNCCIWEACGVDWICVFNWVCDCDCGWSCGTESFCRCCCCSFCCCSKRVNSSGFSHYKSIGHKWNADVSDLLRQRESEMQMWLIDWLRERGGNTIPCFQ